MLNNGPIERIDLLKVAERDKWCCQLCGGKVARDGRSKKDPMGPSLDHIVPVSLGGTHTWANVQLAHLRCNVSKGNRPANEQLRLVG